MTPLERPKTPLFCPFGDVLDVLYNKVGAIAPREAWKFRGLEAWFDRVGRGKRATKRALDRGDVFLGITKDTKDHKGTRRLPDRRSRGVPCTMSSPLPRRGAPASPTSPVSPVSPVSPASPVRLIDCAVGHIGQGALTRPREQSVQAQRAKPSTATERAGAKRQTFHGHREQSAPAGRQSDGWPLVED